MTIKYTMEQTSLYPVWYFQKGHGLPPGVFLKLSAENWKNFTFNFEVR